MSKEKNEDRVKAIKPEEILFKKIETIPDAIMQAVNQLIALKWDGNSAEIKRCEIFERYFEITNSTDSRENRDALLLEHALDFKYAYMKEGWEIRYDYPGMGDFDFEPYYTFKIKK
jgi:hypothetical protein